MKDQTQADALWCILKRPLLADEWEVCLRFRECTEAVYAFNAMQPEVGCEYALVPRPWNKQIDPERVAAATRVVRTLEKGSPSEGA